EVSPRHKKIGGHSRYAGDVSSRVHKTFNEPSLNEIAGARHHDRNGAGGFLGGNGHGGAADDDDVGLFLDQLTGELRQPVHFSFSVLVLHDDVLTLLVAYLAQMVSRGLRVAAHQERVARDTRAYV